MVRGELLQGVGDHAPAGFGTTTFQPDLLEQRLSEAWAPGSSRIVLDVRGLQFMDSTGLHVLLRAHARGQARERELILRHVPAAIQRVIELTGTDRILLLGA